MLTVRAVVAPEAPLAPTQIILTSDGDPREPRVGDEIAIHRAEAAGDTAYHPLKTYITVREISGEYAIAHPTLFYTLASAPIKVGDFGVIVLDD